MKSTILWTHGSNVTLPYFRAWHISFIREQLVYVWPRPFIHKKKSAIQCTLDSTPLTAKSTMGWLRLVGPLKVQVSFAEYSLFYRALLQKRLIILRSLLIVATPYSVQPWRRMNGRGHVLCSAILLSWKVLFNAPLTVISLWVWQRFSLFVVCFRPECEDCKVISSEKCVLFNFVLCCERWSCGVATIRTVCSSFLHWMPSL